MAAGVYPFIDNPKTSVYFNNQAGSIVTGDNQVGDNTIINSDSGASYFEYTGNTRENELADGSHRMLLDLKPVGDTLMESLTVSVRTDPNTIVHGVNLLGASFNSFRKSKHSQVSTFTALRSGIQTVEIILSDNPSEIWIDWSPRKN